MKKLIVLLFGFFLFNPIFCQIIINKSQSFFKPLECETLDTTKIEYLHVIPHARLLSVRFTCEIDYGQKNGLFFFKVAKIRDFNKSKIIFNSESDIINYIAKNGWEYIEYDSWAFIFKKRQNKQSLTE